MIDKPKIGMRVNVDDPKHCFEGQHYQNHGGPGVITGICDDYYFRVLLDDSSGEWWRCRECVTELDKGVINEQ